MWLMFMLYYIWLFKINSGKMIHTLIICRKKAFGILCLALQNKCTAAKSFILYYFVEKKHFCSIFIPNVFMFPTIRMCQNEILTMSTLNMSNKFFRDWKSCQNISRKNYIANLFCQQQISISQRMINLVIVVIWPFSVMAMMLLIIWNCALNTNIIDYEILT